MTRVEGDWVESRIGCLFDYLCFSQLEHVKQLLAVGVDVNARDGSEKANTALHFAASYANADMINCLCGE